MKKEKNVGSLPLRLPSSPQKPASSFEHPPFRLQSLCLLYEFAKRRGLLTPKGRLSGPKGRDKDGQTQ